MSSSSNKNEHNKKLSYSLIAIIFFIMAFILYASYPGYMNADSVNQLIQVYTGNYNDWHSPFVTLVWAILHDIIPGPFSFILLNNILIWGGLSALFYALYQRFGLSAAVVLIIPFFPGGLNFLGNVHKDVMLVAWLLAASVLGYMSHIKNHNKLLFQVLANVCLLAAFLTRSNAIFAIIPLLIYTNSVLKFKYNILTSIIILILMPLTQNIITTTTNAQASSPSDSIKTYHLLGISYLENENLFPGKWTDDQSKKIVEACYTEIQWDSAALWGKCSFIHSELIHQNLWGSSKLTKKWIKEVLRHPLSIFTVMSSTFYKSMFNPNSTSMFYKPDKVTLFDWEVQSDPARLSTLLIQNYVNSYLNNYIGRPWFFALTSIVGLVIIFRFNLLSTNYGLFSFSLLNSSLIYLLSYFFITVSAEFRYFYWSGIASYLGLAMLLFAWLSRDEKNIGFGFHKQLKITTFVTISFIVGVTLSNESLPQLYRTISITPLDDKPVSLHYLRRASIPDWMGVRLDGTIEPHQWVVDSEGFINGSRQNGTLTTTITTFGQAIEVGYKTGPEYGKVLVSIDNQDMIVNLSKSSNNLDIAYIWPTSENLISKHYFAWKRLVKVSVYAIAMFLFLLWFTRKTPHKTVAH